MAEERLPSPLAERGVTRREAEVLTALAERVTNAELAARLYLSERTVESHISSLLRKLGARDRVELGDLARELRSARPEHATALPAPLALQVESGRFVGREPELGRLRELWRRAGAGRVLMGVVTGAAGLGKSRMVAELAAEVHRAGARVLLGSCFEDLRAPYDPFVQAISADLAGLPGTELARRLDGAARPLAWIVPELRQRGGANGAGDPAAGQARLYAAVHHYLLRAAESGPLLVVIEDVHWATGTTMGALRHLARVSGHAPLLVLVTARLDPTGDDPPASLLAERDRLPALEEIPLHGLSESEVAALVAALGRDVDAAELHAQTDGNPLLVRVSATHSAHRSGSLQRLLAARYAMLERRDLAVLDLAAVVGVEFDADIVALAGGLALPAVIDSLERAELAGLLGRQVGSPGRFSFLHVLFRNARYDGIPAGHRTHLHRQVAQALNEAGEESLPALAHHASAAAPLLDELADRARQALRVAGDRALALNDFAAAGQAYGEALRLWPEDDPGRPRLLLGLGRALFTTQNRGTEILTEARDRLLAAGDPDGAAEAESMLGELAWVACRWDEAVAHLERAAGLVAGRSTEAAGRVTADLARLWMIAGANRAARDLGRRALELARAHDRKWLEARVLITVGPARVADGDLAGLADVESGVALAETLGSPEIARGYANLSYVHGILGEGARSRDMRTRARDAAERFGLAPLDLWFRAHDIEDRFLLGHWDDALAGAEAFIAGEEAAAHYLITVCLRVRAKIRMGRGNVAGAVADAAAGVEFARGSRHPSNLLVALPYYARCLLEAGRRSDAGRAVAESLAAARDNPNLLDPIDTALVLTELGRDPEYAGIAARITVPSKRAAVGALIAGDDLPAAADLLAAMEHRSTEAFVRLLAAERLAAAGRTTDAAAQAGRSLAFHRSVGASAYVRRGERVAVMSR